MRILVHSSEAKLHELVREAATRLDADVDVVAWEPSEDGAEESETDDELRPDIVITSMGNDEKIDRVRLEARREGAALVVACHDTDECRQATLAKVDDWFLLPVDADELEMRLQTARNRITGQPIPHDASDAAELLHYQELLYDKLTGFPTLPVMIDRARELLERQGELNILYIHFVRYSKIEEIYGWQKLDDVLETTAQAVRTFYEREHEDREKLIMVSHTGDDDFILLTNIPAEEEVADRRLTEFSKRLETFVQDQLEKDHGEDIAALCGIYVGTSIVFHNPKIRTERLIYRALREAAEAARGAEDWEKAQKVADLKETLDEGAVFIEYHPIIVTATEEIYGYEALARGVRRELRSPEVLFEVAEEANMIWELSRLLRRRAIGGIMEQLPEDEFLFLNIDPHDFDDPSFRDLDPKELGIEDPSRIVLEITERTAIKDYPKFQGYLDNFRELGFKFAVDDAGSGYAGLGSIANLAPDYIKLDISLIAQIETNFLKQHLVETIVGFANTHGAKVVAEGVERREEFETVKELGVHLTQGFLFHRPRYSTVDDT